MADKDRLKVDGKLLSDLRVIDLKQELEKRGMSKSGSKRELHDRLKSQLQLEKLREEASESQGEDDAPAVQVGDKPSPFIQQYMMKREQLLKKSQEEKRRVQEEKLRRESESQTSASENEDGKSGIMSPTTASSPNGTAEKDEDSAEDVSKSEHKTRHNIQKYAKNKSSEAKPDGKMSTKQEENKPAEEGKKISIIKEKPQEKTDVVIKDSDKVKSDKDSKVTEMDKVPEISKGQDEKHKPDEVEKSSDQKKHDFSKKHVEKNETSGSDKQTSPKSEKTTPRKSSDEPTKVKESNKVDKETSKDREKIKVEGQPKSVDDRDKRRSSEGKSKRVEEKDRRKSTEEKDKKKSLEERSKSTDEKFKSSNEKPKSAVEEKDQKKSSEEKPKSLEEKDKRKSIEEKSQSIEVKDRRKSSEENPRSEDVKEKRKSSEEKSAEVKDKGKSSEEKNKSLEEKEKRKSSSAEKPKVVEEKDKRKSSEEKLKSVQKKDRRKSVDDKDSKTSLEEKSEEKDAKKSTEGKSKSSVEKESRKSTVSKSKSAEEVNIVETEDSRKRFRSRRSGSASSSESSEDDTSPKKSRKTRRSSSGSSRSSSNSSRSSGSRSESDRDTPKKVKGTVQKAMTLQRERIKKDIYNETAEDSFHTASEDVSMVVDEKEETKTERNKNVQESMESDQQKEELAKPTEVKAARPPRKRKWGSTRTNKKASINVSTQLLKESGIITDISSEILKSPEPVLELSVKEDVESAEESEEDNKKICRTVTQEIKEDQRMVVTGSGGEEKRDKSGSDSEEDKKSSKDNKQEDSDSSDNENDDNKENTSQSTKEPTIIRRIGQQTSLPADEPEKVRKEASPSRRPASNIIHVYNLVRPFTLGQLKSVLSKTGPLMEEGGFWMDKIKSNCVAAFQNEEDAVEARKALHGTRWPSSNPKILRVDFTTQRDLDHYLEKDKPPPKAADLPEAAPKRKPPPQQPEQARSPQKLREWDRDKVRQSRSRSVERQARRRSSVERRSKERKERREQRERSKERKKKKVPTATLR